MLADSIVRSSLKNERIAVAKKLLNQHWDELSYQQINLLTRYIRMFG